ncbi:hypothetical protein HYU13_03900 [Candidatus Woesearchaeota archaeon]|nr:hypothetical protein [Candidatus Woesearchaeota archaeon]
MAKVFLVSRPKHDTITSYLFAFSQEIVKTVKEMEGIHLTELPEESATRENLEKALAEDSPKLVFLNGHGNKRNVAGHKDEIILDEINIHLSEGKIIYALSCDSLEELGYSKSPKFSKIQKVIYYTRKSRNISIINEICYYIGYSAKFMIVIDPSRTASPNKDRNALPFKKACATLINSLVFGETVTAAIARTKEEYRQSIRSFGTSEDDPYGDVPLVRFALAWNLEFLDMRGDGEASF